MTGTILLFGRLKDVFGAPSIPLPEGVATAAELRLALARAHPELAGALTARTTRIAVNQELVADEAAQLVTAEDEIALLPPLSGG